MRYLLAALFVSFVSIAAWAAEPAPQRVTIIACQIEPGHYVEDMAKQGIGVFPARDWVDTDWKIVSDAKGFHLDCFREVVPLQDAALVADPTGQWAKPLNSDFSDPSQCGHVALAFGPQWAIHHPGYAAIVACPARMVDIRPDGSMRTIGWKDADCPPEIGGLRVVCRETDAI